MLPEPPLTAPKLAKTLKKTALLVVLGTSENLLNTLLGPVLSVSALFSQHEAKKLPKCFRT